MTRGAAWALPLLLLTASLTGCVVDDTASADDGPDGRMFAPNDAADRPAPTSGAGSPDTHGEPTVEEGETQASQNGTLWRATRTVRITNDLGGASLTDTTVRTTAGAITALPGSVQGTPLGGYGILVTLAAQAPTEAQARGAVEAMGVAHIDDLDGATLTLSTTIEDVSLDADPAALATGGAAVRSASLTLDLPLGPRHDLDLATTAGAIAVQGLDTGTVALQTLGGSVSLTDVAADTITASTQGGAAVAARVAATTVDLSTSGGAVGFQGIVTDLAARTGGGGVSVSATTPSSGTLDLRTEGGGVGVSLTSTPLHGFDVLASTYGGGIHVDIPDGEEVEGDLTPYYDPDEHVRTRGYDDRDIRTEVVAHTNGGGVSVVAGPG